MKNLKKMIYLFIISIFLVACSNDKPLISEGIINEIGEKDGVYENYYKKFENISRIDGDENYSKINYEVFVKDADLLIKSFNEDVNTESSSEEEEIYYNYFLYKDENLSIYNEDVKEVESYKELSEFMELYIKIFQEYRPSDELASYWHRLEEIGDIKEELKDDIRIYTSEDKDIADGIFYGELHVDTKTGILVYSKFQDKSYEGIRVEEMNLIAFDGKPNFDKEVFEIDIPDDVKYIDEKNNNVGNIYNKIEFEDLKKGILYYPGEDMRLEIEKYVWEDAENDFIEEIYTDKSGDFQYTIYVNELTDSIKDDFKYNVDSNTKEIFETKFGEAYLTDKKDKVIVFIKDGYEYRVKSYLSQVGVENIIDFINRLEEKK